MGAYLVRRVMHLVAVLVAVLIVVSVILRLIPGDPIDAIMAGNPGITEEDKTRLRDQLGLNDPMPVQIVRYAGGVLRGDLGDSLRTRAPARPQIVEKLPPTIELTVFAMIVAVLVAVPLGVVTAMNRDRWPDYLGSIVAVFGISVPSFLLGILLVLLLAVHWRVFPASGYGGSLTGAIKELVTDGDIDPLKKSLRYLLLPGITLGVSISAYSARIVRSAMVEVIRQDYIRCARAKGLPARIVFLRHAFRNALIPVVTILGLQIGYLLSGAFVVENVFAWPGIGRYSVQALGWRDYPVVQGVVMITALVFLTINLLVDLLYVAIDPRIRLR
ncbi:MAG: peptide/nickel transport system permease protein [Thermomicrobiales bacterium]|nr:peptide/nickel transport system permease protein [Thermomicrobiales bacterium]MEA2597653.1 peptide/nickel transport system permease protein [Thermomicrobiales bacterium]